MAGEIRSEKRPIGIHRSELLFFSRKIFKQDILLSCLVCDNGEKLTKQEKAQNDTKSYRAGGSVEWHLIIRKRTKNFTCRKTS